MTKFCFSRYDSGGEIDFHVDKDLEHPWSWGDSAVVNKWYSENKNKIIKVKAVQLSSFLNKPTDLLKLDVEGLEERILLSIEDKFNNIGEIMMEYHSSSTNPNNDISNVLTVLRKNGFRCRINQGGQFIKEEQIKKDDPFWLSIYAKKLSSSTN